MITITLELSEFRSFFWERIDIKDPIECWPWLGLRSSEGYGRLRIKEQDFSTHRLALLFSRGFIENFCCHKCGNRICNNPSHLFDGTHRENMEDSKCTKLSKEDVEIIRNSKDNQFILGTIFGVNQSQISKIKSFKRRT